MKKQELILLNSDNIIYKKRGEINKFTPRFSSDF